MDEFEWIFDPEEPALAYCNFNRLQYLNENSREKGISFFQK